MAQLFVHLAPAADVAKYEGDKDPGHHYASALVDFGQWHKVDRFTDTPGDHETQESRSFVTVCGIEQDDRPSRMEEADNEPGGDRCPKCFGKKGGK